MGRLKDSTAADLIPEKATLKRLREVARGCTACDLYKRGTQTVFGAGSTKARLVFVGEQPGNDEDLIGLPFVGPAGKLLDASLKEAGIDRGDVYVTNVVKHFKWEARGKRRIHKKPSAGEIHACLPWLEAEIAALRPKLVVCLGATAAQAIMGGSFRVTKQRGEVFDSPLGIPILATVHPSSILRAPDDETRRRERGLFVRDLRAVAAAM